MGIEETKFKKAYTGGMLIKVLGEDNASKANRLVNKLKVVLSDKEIFIYRLLKKDELRFIEMDDSITKKKTKKSKKQS